MYNLTKDESNLVNEVCQLARKEGIFIDDYFVIRKNGRLIMLFTRKDTGGKIHQFDIGSYV